MKRTLLMLLASFGLATMGSAQVTFKAVAGSDWGNDEGSDKVCDGNKDTKWCKNGDDDETKCYVILEASEATYIQGFKMTTANDNEKWAGRTPKTYTISGCDTKDGTYETIYYQADDNLIGDVNFKEYTIYCNSKKKYKYFKLWIKDSNINGGRMFQLSEFTLIPSTMGFSFKDGKEKAVDGKTSEKWEDNPTTSVTVEATEPTYLVGYQFTTANDNAQYTGRNPADWKIEGSNDCSDWHEIVNETNNTELKDVNYVPYYFPLANPLDTAYRYYRVTVTKAQGGGYFQLGEVSFVGTTTPVVRVNIGSTGYATVASDKPLDFTGTNVNAYVVQLKDNYAHLEPVSVVPANTAVVVQATSDNYLIPVSDNDQTEIPQNDLKVSDGNVQGGSSIFVLGNKSKGIGFYPTAETLSLPRGKGYLEIDATAEVQAFLSFGEGTETSIADTMSKTTGVADIYNLSGQRVSRMQKGVNIVNGKKIIY